MWLKTELEFVGLWPGKKCQYFLLFVMTPLIFTDVAYCSFLTVLLSVEVYVKASKGQKEQVNICATAHCLHSNYELGQRKCETGSCSEVNSVYLINCLLTVY